MGNFFEGLKVIELAGVLAGPGVGLFFAELGAEVIKIENKKSGGDVTRNWRLKGEAQEGPSAYFCAVNWNKKYLFLDLSSEEDRNELMNLIKTADMVISNFSQRVASKLKVGYSELKAQKEDIIFIQLDGFLNNNRPAYDVVLQAETGWISMNGTPGHQAKLPVALIDIVAGHQLKEGALLAIIHRMRTGKGSYVSCNLEQASLSALANQATNYLMNGAVAKPMGTLHPNIAPYGDMFSTKDGRKIVLAVGSDHHFKALLDTLNLNGETSGGQFSDNQMRVENRSALARILESAIEKKNFYDLATAFEKAGVPFGQVKSLDEVLTSPAAVDLLLKEEIEGHYTHRLSGNAFKADFLAP